MSEHVILVAGPMGAGKTTAIQALSEIPVVSTEAENTDRATADKPTTTVALDYGEISLDENEKVRIYGVPGQRRFSFMWRILEERALGLILLVNNDAKDPIGEAEAFLKEFSSLQERGGVVIGITRTDVAPHPKPQAYAERIRKTYPGISIPVFKVDARSAPQIMTALTALLFNIESQQAIHEMEIAS
jgi:uncharacterized protein